MYELIVSRIKNVKINCIVLFCQYMNQSKDLNNINECVGLTNSGHIFGEGKDPKKRRAGIPIQRV